MRLIDADVLMEKEYSRLREGEVLHRIPTSHVDAAPTIDPVHAANACYCKECQYYEPFRDYPDCSKKLSYGYCYYWKYEEGESPNEVDETDFCSKGVPKNV